MKLAAGIVTYYPDMARLEQCMASLLSCPELDRLYVVDNGTPDCYPIQKSLDGFQNVVLIRNDENLGIAQALDALCRTANDDGYDWLLAMDQDSVMSAGYFRHYYELTLSDCAGIVCCRVEDINFGRMYNAPECGSDEVKCCITSGSMIRLSMWKSIGGFDESMFIDGVDFDFSIRVVNSGYRLYRTCDAFICHRIGNGRFVRFLGKKALILNHKPERLYYIARNYLYLGKKYSQKLHWCCEVLKRFCLVLFFEDDRAIKIRAMFDGIIDCFDGKMGKCLRTYIIRSNNDISRKYRKIK